MVLLLTEKKKKEIQKENQVCWLGFPGVCRGLGNRSRDEFYFWIL